MDNDIKELFSRARILFTAFAVIDSVAFLLVFILHHTNMSFTPDSKTVWLIGLVTLFFVAVTSIALPIMLRTLFMAQRVKTKIFELSGYKQLVLWTIALPMCGAFAAAIAYYFNVPKLHLLTIMMFSLYGVYSAIPATKKINGEIEYFQRRFS